MNVGKISYKEEDKNCISLLDRMILIFLMKMKKQEIKN